MKYPYKKIGVDFDETFRTDLNQALDDIENDIREAQGETGSAKADLQTQINTLVINGDSSPAAAQAAIDAKGVNKGTLKQRLDDDYNEHAALLAQKAAQADLNTTNQNVTDTNTRLDNLVIGSGNANAEVTDAHTSAAKSKTFTTLKNRLEELETDAYLLAKNLIINSGFTDTTNWYIPYATSTAASNELTVTKSSSSTAARIEQQGFASIVGHKYYVRGDIYPKYATATSITIGGTAVTKTVTVNQWNTVAGITTPTASSDFQFIHSNVGYATGDTFKFRRILMLDLTVMFGAGNEPSQTEIETFLANFTNSWFDGNVQFANPTVIVKRLSQKQDASSAVTSASNLPITDSGNYFSGANAESALQEVGANTYLLATNVIQNGDFSNGGTNWFIGSGTDIESNNILTFTPTSSSTAARIEQVNTKPIAGHKYYVRGDIYPLHPNPTSIVFGNATLSYSVITNQWNKVSGIITPVDTTDFQFIHSSVGYVTGETIQYRSVMAVDLTTLFGAGNEPSLSQFESMLSKFGNSWFNGTINIVTPLQMYGLMKQTVQPLTFTGKNLVCFGDSITGEFFYPVDYPTIIANTIGINAYNVGFGGCMMAIHPNAMYAPFSMCNLADAIVSGDFSTQTAQLSAGVPNYYTTRLNTLKSIDFNTVDYISIQYMTNDWNNGNLVESADTLDKNTFKGALRYALNTLLTKFPQLKIILIPAIYRFDLTTGNDSDVMTSSSGLKLTDFVQGAIDIGKEYKYPVANTYYGLGFNKFTRGYYFPSTDGTHPNDIGRALLGKKIADCIKNEW
jgi:lysophospholipase L1-like esterase